MEEILKKFVVLYVPPSGFLQKMMKQATPEQSKDHPHLHSPGAWFETVEMMAMPGA